MNMKRVRDFFGYLLGGVLFVALIPTIMWLASGMPALWPIDMGRCIVAPIVMFVGLVLSVWTIVYMRNRGKGNPMDAFGHEVAPRTQHLMIEGPYKINRNPMLTGTLVYLVGAAVWLWTWQSCVVFVAFFAIMMVQVLSEEKRLRRDFGEEYEEYCKHSRRF
jgi:protein-S-isoprenylcysteine O-methyltransferase Ste14